ncbi:DUF2778 domain-containing protein [Thalassotalea euphylliae]|uniref:DUF2778 domain-containing protein n=1 Tax=Thalassotalea euphylliae TaxID=1655234 RepID=A0A3E0TR08_9GAMM|nr:tlde1 domain-containing protein [Thalassotalea euphylliae]REL27046.1 DUF2778 domain-containing protein [Thalassotalea euphylliae]
MKMIFSIEARKLYVQSSTFSGTYPATSGRGECRNNNSKSCQKAEWQGPIPVGNYIIRSSDLSDPGIIGDLARNTRGDWGDWRVRLIPATGTQTYGRKGFFLHGGSKSGSAGCIDIGGGISGSRETNLIKSMIMASGTVQLEVR